MLTLGNLTYEPGDTLWLNVEFLHQFPSVAEISAEFGEGGFELVHLDFPEDRARGGAVLRAAASTQGPGTDQLSRPRVGFRASR